MTVTECVDASVGTRDVEAVLLGVREESLRPEMVEMTLEKDFGGVLLSLLLI